MKHSKLLVGGLLALLVQVTANAQVYESEDAEGVPEFSDSPTPGAEVVDIPSTNLMNAPAAEAAPPRPTPQQAESVPGGDEMDLGEGENVYYSGDDEDNVRAQRRLDEERIEHVIPGNVDHEGAGMPGARPGEPGVPEAVRPAGGEAVHHEAGGRR